MLPPLPLSPDRSVFSYMGCLVCTRMLMCVIVVHGWGVERCVDVCVCVCVCMLVGVGGCMCVGYVGIACKEYNVMFSYYLRGFMDTFC